MRFHRVLSLAVVVVLLAFTGFAVVDVDAQRGAALGGVVSSREEGKMEGVLVTARREGSSVAVTVVSDAQGRFSFPRTHLAPGTYGLTIRAVGYDLTDPGALSLAANKTATANLTLVKTKDLASQLSSLEWAMSMPGTEEQKSKLVYQLLSCAYCHTYERIMKSKFSAEQLVPVISRMQTYFQDGTALGAGGRGRAQRNEGSPEAAAKNPSWSGVPKVDMAQHLAAANLSGGKATWSYELKTLPRPKGKATRVIMTQYDMPRKDTVPHDLDVDMTGTPWYGDQTRMFVGKLDPKSGIFTDYPLPPLPPGRVGGISDTHVDRDGHLWFPITIPTGSSHFGYPAQFDTKTQQLTVLDQPENGPVQFLAMGPDGKIWMNSTNKVVRVDPKAMKVDASFTLNAKTANAPPGGHAFYQLGITSKGVAYGTDWLGSYIISIDPATGAMQFFATPTRSASPRRAKMDAQDRFWFAEYTGDRIGMIDTRTNEIKEWPVPLKYTTPYAASSPDKNGYVYATSNMSERVLRLDPKSGEVIEYQVPTDFDSKEIVHDPTTSRVTLWMANTRNARILKVEPLD